MMKMKKYNKVLLERYKIKIVVRIKKMNFYVDVAV